MNGSCLAILPEPEGQQKKNMPGVGNGIPAPEFPVFSCEGKTDELSLSDSK